MTFKAHDKARLSRHPLFPAIIALWFAALLGMGSFAIRNSVLENAVLALGIDRLVPAAAPPLGLTARLLLALGLALVGAVAGFVLARLLARGAGRRAEAPPARQAAATPEETVETEDGEDLARLEAARAALPQRRRALTMEEPAELPAPARPDRASPSILNVGDLEAVTPLAAEAEAEAAAEAAPEPGLTDVIAAPADAPSAPNTAAGRAGHRLRTAPLESLGMTELVERFALALADRKIRQERRSAAPALQRPEAAVSAPLPATPEAAASASPVAVPLSRTPAPFADDSHRPEGGDLQFSGLDARPFAMPPSLREPGLGNIEWFDEAEEEATLDSLLPPKRLAPHDPLEWTASAESSPAQDPDEEDAAPADPEDEAPFSSLLDMKPSARPPAALPPFVRVEETESSDIAEPVVVFPGQVAAAVAVPARLPGAPFGATPVETEAALREALAALQKMSGAA